MLLTDAELILHLYRRVLIWNPRASNFLSWCTLFHTPIPHTPSSARRHCLVGRVGRPKLTMLLFWVVIVVLLPGLVSCTCYLPNGAVTPHDVPCENGHESVCCSEGFICLSNSVCQKRDAANDTVGYARGSCTDKSWRSSYCPNYCVRSGAPWNDSLTHRQPMEKCSDTGHGDIYFCKDDNVQAVDCANKKAVVSFSGKRPTPVTSR